MTIEPKYVTFDQAKKLEVKGFDVECKKIYNTLGRQWDSHYGTMKNSDPDSGAKCTCPEHWQVIAWLESVHDIWVHVSYIDSSESWHWDVYKIHNGLLSEPEVKTNLHSYSSAYSAAFDYILDKIICG